MRKKIVAGNWKMNLDYESGKSLAEEVVGRVKHLKEDQNVVLIPPYVHLAAVGKITEGCSIKLGAQNCHAEKEGAYTGEISAAMLASVNTEYCLVGHSERRSYNAETDEELLKKTKSLLSEGIQPIFCCGEQLEDRKSDLHFDKVGQQLEVLWKLTKEEFEKVVIAYEPVWAIGTGETATADQAQGIHAFIRGLVKKYVGIELAENTTILYGGSCKPANAQELFAMQDIDGGLIGGAALKSDDFVAIVNAMNS